MSLIFLKRVYDVYEKTDGTRVLIDRLWPRGLSKEKAKVDFWLKDIAPSDTLRKWFGHDPEKWEKFKIKYKDELRGKTQLVNEIKNLKGRVTLLYSAKDTEHNNGVVLAEYLKHL